MDESSIPVALDGARDRALRLLSVKLVAPRSRLFRNSVFELTLPVDHVTVVLGPNGSGKSLLAAALQLTLGPNARDNDLRPDLLSAGIEQIEVGLDYRSAVGTLLVELETGGRSLHWMSPDATRDGHGDENGLLPRADVGGWEGLFGTDVGASLFTQVNIIRGGSAELPFGDQLLAWLREEALEPLRRELHVWKARRLDLTGEQGDGGKLGLARDQLGGVEERIRYVEEVRAKLDQARRRQADLQIQLDDLGVQQKMVRAELEEWLKLSTLADRARRVHTWLDEIQREYADVAWLRDEHENQQGRLDKLEAVFRGAPDNLDELLDAFRAKSHEESLLLERLNVMRLQGAQLEEAIAAARHDLDVCVPPSADGERAERERRRVQVEEAEQEMSELLRGRTELMRRREDLQAQIARDFQAFHELDATAREHLEEYFEWEEQAEERALKRKSATAEAQERAASRRETLRSELRTTFEGFDSLAANTADSLRVLFDCRRVAGSIPADKAQLERTRTDLENRVKARGKWAWTVTPGVVGVVAGAILGGWDIALFLGLAASGAGMLAGKLSSRGVEKQLGETVAALTEAEARKQETEAMIQRLQMVVGPLGQCVTLSEALARWNQYHQLKAELEQLSVSGLPPESDLDDADQAVEDRFARLLPSRVLAMPVAAAQVQFVRCREIEDALKSLDRVWEEYEEGGTNWRAIREEESRVAKLRQELERAIRESESRMQSYEARRRELNEQLTVLESARAVGQTAEQVDAELRRVRAEKERLVSQSGGFLERDGGEALAEQVRSLRELRIEIRKVRDSLSSRQSLDELRAREALLAEELEEMKQKLSALDPLYLLDGTVADYATKYNRQLERAGEALSLNESALESVKKDLEAVEVDHWTTVLAGCESLDSLRGQQEVAHEHLERIEHEASVAHETVVQLQADHDDQYRNFESGLMTNLAESLQLVTDGRCRALRHANGRLSVELSDQSTRNLSALSAGMRDLVWMAVRLTLLDQPSASPAMPMIWDEPFSNLDDHYLQRIRGSLKHVADGRQVLVLSRDHRLKKWGTVVELPTDIVEGELVRV